jgi:predicted enzyme related to lactoylglutathione lyase
MDLDSAILYSNDIARIRKFYEQTVGLKFEYQDGDHYVSFIFPNGGRLGINKPEPQFAARDKPGHQTVFIRTKEIRKEYERCQKLGLEFFEPYEEHDWGTFFAVLDPDGNKPTVNKFAAEGEFEYITVDSPAFYPEQTELVPY